VCPGRRGERRLPRASRDQRRLEPFPYDVVLKCGSDDEPGPSPSRRELVVNLRQGPPRDGPSESSQVATRATLAPLPFGAAGIAATRVVVEGSAAQPPRQNPREKMRFGPSRSLLCSRCSFYFEGTIEEFLRLLPDGRRRGVRAGPSRRAFRLSSRSARHKSSGATPNWKLFFREEPLTPSVLVPGAFRLPLPSARVASNHELPP